MKNVTPQDDLFHPRNDDPYWNESAWFTLSVPERDIDGYVYFYHRPNMNLSAGGPALWDPSGEQIYDCLYWDWDCCQPLPKGAEMHEFELINSLTCRTIELQRKYAFTYASQELQLDLVWEAFMTPQLMMPLNGKTNPGIDEWLATDGITTLSLGHYEQFGRMTGTLTLHGETIPVDCYSQRDHTWGPRNLRHGYPRVGWSWGIANPEHHFMHVAVSKLPYAEDPIDGTVEEVVHGWYAKDGQMAKLVSGTRQAERGPDGRPIRNVLHAVDELGRELNIEGTTRNTMWWTGYNDCLTVHCLADWAFDGIHAYGQALDYFTFRQNRQLQRTLRTQQANALTTGATR